jgi:hypothetical protein
VQAVTPLPLDDLSSAYHPRHGGLQLYAGGAKGGLLAGTAVFAVLFLYDLFRLDPLASPILLSGAALGQPIEVTPGVEAALRAADVIRVSAGLAKYAVLHFSVFAAIGIGAALFFQRGSVAVNTLTGALYGIVACSAVFYTGIALLAGSFLATPDWRIVVGANAVAGVIMVANLLGDRDAAC